MTPYRSIDLGRRLRGFWFADIVGFTSLSHRDEDAALRAVELLRQHAADEVERAGGELVKVSGDAVLAHFPSSNAALHSALALRDALAVGELTLPLHFGVHQGEISSSGGDIYGDGVNTAARLQAWAGAGQILASDDVYRHTRASGAFRFTPYGQKLLKGLPEPVRAYSVERATNGNARAAAIEPEPAIEVERIIVLPFLMLRPDEEIEFLPFSLAEEIAFSLSKLNSVVVRSPSAASQFAGRAADPREVAMHTDVDLVVEGTLLRHGDRLLVTAKLTDGRDGTLLDSFRTQSAIGDVFDLQESLTRRIVQALQLTLSPGEKKRILRDTPASADAYDFYLRAKTKAHQSTDWEAAAAMFRHALSIEPTFAPAYAELGRCYRLLAKYARPQERGELFEQAQAAFTRALELNPDLELAHGFAAQLDAELGRCGDAMLRLLDRLEHRPRGVALLSGLVHALRYCGLLEESLAADAAARAIDRSARTSIENTYLMLGRFDDIRGVHASDLFIHAYTLMLRGRRDEAKQRLAVAKDAWATPATAYALRPLQLLLDGQVQASVEAGRSVYRDFPDPEGRLLFARHLAFVGNTDEALDMIEDVAGEYAAFPPPGVDPWLSSIDRTDRYRVVLEQAAARAREFRDRVRAHPASRFLKDPPDPVHSAM